jgi:hypothetical protein
MSNKHKASTADGRTNRAKTAEELADFERQQEVLRKEHLENVILDLSLASASKSPGIPPSRVLYGCVIIALLQML